MIEMEIVQDPLRFTALRSEWTELLAHSRSDSLFLSWEWLHTWWKHLSDGRRLRIVALWESGRLIALAPLCLRARRWRRLVPFPVLEFLGSGIIGSDYLDVIIREGSESAAVAALSSALGQSRNMVELSQVLKGLARVDELTTAMGRHGWHARQKVTDVCPYIDLRGHDWSSFLSRLGSAHRYNFGRRHRKLHAAWTLRFETAACDLERKASLDMLVQLHRRRWHERHRSGAFELPAVLGFHEEFSRLALARGWLRLHILYLDHEPAAAIYGFNYRDRFYFYQSGFDPKFRQWSVGLVMMGLTIQQAIREGVREFDFLRGDESYKFLWTSTQRELVRWELFPPGERGALYRHTMELRGELKRVALSLNLLGDSV